ncbi:hypothetical protein BSKO_07987 [Bryopsis sp. KO-2023]|nr:hypothetical protein BSKO_07987 [Bryopsis sp. KO-2023]
MAPNIPGTVTAESLTRSEQLWKTWDRDAKKEGERRTVYWVGGNKYLGEWKNNKKHGKGTFVYKNGDKYEGDWVNGKRHGLGTLWQFSDGKYKIRYNGHWRDDTPWGNGLFYDDNGNLYEGEWVNGKRHGRGRAVYGGRSIDAFGGDVYEGDWENDFRQGHGTMTYGNGDIFEGHWKADMKDGRGTMYFLEKEKRLDGIWVTDTPKCGTYSELKPHPPGNVGAIPPLELKFPQHTLAQAQQNATEARS